MSEVEVTNPGDMPEEQTKMPAVPEEQEGHYRVLANGAKADIATGKIVAGPVLDSGRARELAAMRQVKAQAAVRRAIAAGDTTHDLAHRNVYGGFETIAAAQVELALSPETGRASTEAARWLGRSSGLQSEQQDAGQAPAVRLELGAAAVEALGRLLGRRQGAIAAPEDGAGAE